MSLCIKMPFLTFACLQYNGWHQSHDGIIIAAQKKVATSANEVDSNFLCLCNLTKAILILGTLEPTSISIYIYITTKTEMRTVWWWWIYPARLLFQLLACFCDWHHHAIQWFSQLYAFFSNEIFSSHFKHSQHQNLRYFEYFIPHINRNKKAFCSITRFPYDRKYENVETLHFSFPIYYKTKNGKEICNRIKKQ